MAVRAMEFRLSNPILFYQQTRRKRFREGYFRCSDTCNSIKDYVVDGDGGGISRGG